MIWVRSRQPATTRRARLVREAGRWTARTDRTSPATSRTAACRRDGVPHRRIVRRAFRSVRWPRWSRRPTIIVTRMLIIIRWESLFEEIFSESIFLEEIFLKQFLEIFQEKFLKTFASKLWNPKNFSWNLSPKTLESKDFSKVLNSYKLCTLTKRKNELHSM